VEESLYYVYSGNIFKQINPRERDIMKRNWQENNFFSIFFLVSEKY
jgi:hypothetical protein